MPVLTRLTNTAQTAFADRMQKVAFITQQMQRSQGMRTVSALHQKYVHTEILSVPEKVAGILTD